MGIFICEYRFDHPDRLYLKIKKENVTDQSKIPSTRMSEIQKALFSALTVAIIAASFRGRFSTLVLLCAVCRTDLKNNIEKSHGSIG